MYAEERQQAIVRIAREQGRVVPVTIRTNGSRKPVPARSMLGVLSLGAKQGTEVTLEATGDGAEAALEELAELLARDLDAADA